MKLIVGLGNPGNQYTNNRHNVGFMCIAHFAKKHEWPFEKKEGLARTAHGRLDDEEIILARPQTFMNASGEAVKKLTIKYRITPKNLIVVHDEMDLQLGIIRIRQGGSSAGHKGIESVIYEIGTPDFVRLRVGVGHPYNSNSEGQKHVIGHVLGDFEKEEASVIKKVIDDANHALVTLIRDGIERAMNQFNRSNATPIDQSGDTSL